jgi:acetate kinase
MAGRAVKAQHELHCLCINAGSSSLKVGLYRAAAGRVEHCLWRGAAQAIASPTAQLEIDGQRAAQPIPDHLAALDLLLHGRDLTRVQAVGHRMVHGGEHDRPARVTPELLAELRTLVALAPLHLPAALAGVDAVAERLPQIPQVACFDTAFHAGLPVPARTLPLPQRYRELGIRRYGFHGLSCEYIVGELGERARGRLVIAHLGNGASLTALLDGRSVDTSMGFTPSGGVMMGTRSGDMDPGVLLYLLREQGLDEAALERLVNRESGLLGVSGSSPDMEVLLARDDPEARLAVEMFAYQVRKTIGGLSAALGGLDRLVFSGGIGEHAAPVRAAICSGLEYLGIRLDPKRNAARTQRISTDDSPCQVLVVPTNEDRIIARHCRQILTLPDPAPDPTPPGT